MPEAHSKARCHEHSRLPVYFMRYYEFLMEEKESGRLKKWLQLGAPSQLPKWMEIYQYHLLHPELSQLELSTDLNVGHSTIQRALAYMTQELV